MKLSTRFLLLRAIVFLIFALIIWLAFAQMVRVINQQWGKQFAERQVLFDKYRTLSPLIREIRLARRMAAEPALIEMAQHEEDAAIKRRGINVLEKYRYEFRDHSYFAAFAKSGHYYFNDADGQYSGKQLRYTLSPQSNDDKWFYATLKSSGDYQVNVDPDVNLKVVKIWINVLLKHGDNVVGVIGSGIDLTDFLRESVDINQPGVDNFFVDRNMAIQLSTNHQMIDFASIAKNQDERITIDKLFGNPQDVIQVFKAAKRLEQNFGEVATLWVDYQGANQLLGIAYLPEVGWYDLTLMHDKSLKVLDGFSWLPLVFGLIFLVALLVLNLFLNHWVLDPIGKLQVATEQLERGNYEIELPLVGKGEIGALAQSFRHMVAVVRQTNQELEQKVKDRTEDLQRLTEIDPLTGLLNRRGIMDRFEQEIARQTRQGSSLGILLLDLDNFKQVNDTYGHVAGDVALCSTANILQSMKRSYDHAGRWGGEEFLILLPECSEQDLLVIAERIREAVQSLRVEAGTGDFSFTVSIGAHHPKTPQTPDAMLSQADKALYKAKEAGRNNVYLANQVT